MDSFISIDFGTAAVAFESPAVGVASEAATAAPVLSRGTQAPSEVAVEAFQTAMAKPIADNAAVEVAFDSAVKAFNAAVAAVEKTVTPVVADVDSAGRDVQVAVDSVGRDALIPPQQTVVPPPADMTSRRVEVNAPYQAVVAPQAPVAVDQVAPQAPVAVDSVVPQPPVAVDSVGRDDLIPPQQAAVPPQADMSSRRVADNAPVQAVAVSDVDDVPEARAENIIAAGVVPQQQIAAAVDSHVADPAGVQAVDAVSARTVEVAERVSKAMTASEVLIQAAEAVADTIFVSPGLLRGEGEIRVQLRPDVLDGTEIRIGVAGRQLDVSFMPSNADMSALIEQCRPQLEQHLAARIHRFSVSVSVAKKSRSGDD